MKNIISWSVFLITGVLSFGNCVPIPNENTSGGFKLEILPKNNPNSAPIPSGNFIDKLDLPSIFQSVVKHVVPPLLQMHEKGSPPGKETTHQLGSSITQNLTKGLSDAFNSKLGQEFMIAAGIKKRPTLLETLYETIVTYVKWIETATSNKVHEIGEKGLMRTFSDTISGIFGSNGHVTTTTAHEIHKPATSNAKIPQHGTETVMQTRDLGLRDRLNDSLGYGGRRYQGSGPWNNFLYQPYNRHNNPYNSMPPYMGDSFFGYVGYLISSFFFVIQQFFYRFFSGHPPPPPPGGRPSILRRPPQSYLR